MQEQFEEITFLSFSWLVTFHHENHHSNTGADLATRVFIIITIVIITVLIVAIVAIVLIM